MAENNQDFDCYAGETKSLVVTVYDKDDHDAPVDLTGATATWKMKRAGTTILTKTVGGGITFASDPTTGVMTIALSTTDTAQTAGAYTHECRVTLASGDVATVFNGTAQIRTANA